MLLASLTFFALALPLQMSWQPVFAGQQTSSPVGRDVTMDIVPGTASFSALEDVSGGGGDTGLWESFLPPAVVQRCAASVSAPPVSTLYGRALGLLTGLQVARAERWSMAALMALCANDMPLTPEYLSLVFAILEKESSFNAHGLLPNQPDGFRKLAHRLIDDVFAGDSAGLGRSFGQKLAARLLGSAARLARGLGLVSPGDAKRSFDELYARFGWQRIMTEWDIDHTLADDILSLSREHTPLAFSVRAILACTPELRARLESHSLVRTIGPMQTSVGTFRLLFKDEAGGLTEQNVRKIMYSVEGGVYSGVRNLKRFVSVYAEEGTLTEEAVEYIAADYTTGLYASRNSAFLRQFALVSRTEIAPGESLRSSRVVNALKSFFLEGYDEVAVSNTGWTGIWPDADDVQQAASLAGRKELEQSGSYMIIKGYYLQETGQKPAYAEVPATRHYSPKNGRYALSVVVRKTRELFMRNCQVLGC